MPSSTSSTTSTPRRPESKRTQARKGPAAAAAQAGGTRARAAAAWQIVGYVDGDTGERAFGVVQRGRRRAWGLRSREAAESWLRRKKVPLYVQLVLQGLREG